MSDDGSQESSYYSDDDETFEPLSLPKPKTNKPVEVRNISADGEVIDDLEDDNSLFGNEEEEIDDASSYENDEDEDEESDNEDNQYRKITPAIKENLLEKHYPEKKYQNYKEVEILAKVVRDKDGNILDENHKTAPILTKYERTRVLGERTRQIQQGSPIFVENPDNIIDSYVLAEMELQQKKIPFIIQRPLPYGSSIEYWRLADLEIL